MSSIEFTLYRRDTGEILCGGTSSSPELLETEELAVLLGQVFTEGWVENGEWHPIPEDKPSLFHKFDFAAKVWVDPRTEAEVWTAVREKRNYRIAASDWTQLPDVPLVTKEAWAAYRQQLRDITLQPDPFNIIWPTAPQ